MMHVRLRWRLRLMLLLPGLAGASCSREPEQHVAIRTQDNGYLLTMRAKQVEGLCFAPQTVRFNGSLVLDGFKRNNSWQVVRSRSNRIEGLDQILTGERKKIDSDGFGFVVQRDGIMRRPFYFQLVVFPCDAPRRSTGSINDTYIMSITADLAPYRYPRDYGS